MDYEERLGSGFSSIGTSIAKAAAGTFIPPATPGDGGISTHIDNIYQLAVKPDGQGGTTIDLLSLFKDSATRQAIYNALGLSPVNAETVSLSATYKQDEIQKRGSWGEQPGFNDAVAKLPEDYKPKNDLEIVRLFSTYWAGNALALNTIAERWYADKITLDASSDPFSYFKSLSMTEDPAAYLNLLSRWVIYGVRLNPLSIIEADPESIGASFMGYPEIKPQGYKAVSTIPQYYGDRISYADAVNAFSEKLVFHYSENAFTLMNISKYNDQYQLTKVYSAMLGAMMTFIGYAATVLPIKATFKLPNSGSIRYGVGTTHSVMLYSYIPHLSTGPEALGDYSDMPGPWVPVSTDGLTMSPVDSLIYQYLKAVLIIKNQEYKVAGALSKTLDPKSDYGTKPTADQANPLDNPNLVYDPVASNKAGYPVFVDIAANQSKQYMTQRFGKSVTIKDKNMPTVRDYANMPVLRSFYGKSIPIPGGGVTSPAAIQDLITNKKKIPALAWIAGAVAAAAIYYQYKG